MEEVLLTRDWVYQPSVESATKLVANLRKVLDKNDLAWEDGWGQCLARTSALSTVWWTVSEEWNHDFIATHRTQNGSMLIEVVLTEQGRDAVRWKFPTEERVFYVRR